MKAKVGKFFQWVWSRLDNVLALVVAAVCAFLGFKKVIKIDQVIPSLLGVLALLAFGQLRAQSAREKMNKTAEKLRYSIDSLAEAARGSVDDHFHHETDERDIIATAAEQVWLIQETGSLLVERAKDHLLKFVQTGGSVRLVVTLPSLPVARLMAYRNANLLPDEIQGRAGQFRGQLRDLVNCAGDDIEEISVRYIPYPIGWTIAMCDPYSNNPKNRRAICRSAGFRVPFSQKFDMNLSAAEAPLTFQHFLVEVEKHYLHATKIVLLTGMPRSGKTTLLANVLEKIHNNPRVYWVLSRDIIENGERTGFQVETSSTHTPVRFAKRNDDDTYTYEPGSWAPIVKQIRQATGDGRIVVLDEIGPLQFEEPGFLEVIHEIIENPALSLIATISHPDGPHPHAQNTLKSILRSPRASVLRLGGSNDIHRLEKELLDEISASIESSVALAPEWFAN